MYPPSDTVSSCAFTRLCYRKNFTSVWVLLALGAPQPLRRPQRSSPAPCTAALAPDPPEAAAHFSVHHLFCLNVGFAFSRNTSLEPLLRVTGVQRTTPSQWHRGAMPTPAAALAGFNPWEPSCGAACATHPGFNPHGSFSAVAATWCLLPRLLGTGEGKELL